MENENKSLSDSIKAKLAQLDSEARYIPHNVAEMFLHLGELFENRQGVNNQLKPVPAKSGIDPATVNVGNHPDGGLIDKSTGKPTDEAWNRPEANFGETHLDPPKPPQPEPNQVKKPVAEPAKAGDKPKNDLAET